MKFLILLFAMAFPLSALASICVVFPGTYDCISSPTTDEYEITLTQAAPSSNGIPTYSIDRTMNGNDERYSILADGKEIASPVSNAETLFRSATCDAQSLKITERDVVSTGEKDLTGTVISNFSLYHNGSILQVERTATLPSVGSLPISQSSTDTCFKE